VDGDVLDGLDPAVAATGGRRLLGAPALRVDAA
jgi:hypothetical protein